MELNLKDAGKHMPPDVKASLAIHIEAAKRITQYRAKYLGSMNELLPGEEGETQSELPQAMAHS